MKQVPTAVLVAVALVPVSFASQAQTAQFPAVPGYVTSGQVLSPGTLFSIPAVSGGFQSPSNPATISVQRSAYAATPMGPQSLPSLPAAQTVQAFPSSGKKR